MTPILLVHGLFGSLNDPDILNSINNSKAFAPDLLGYGEMTSVSPERISLSAQADHLAQWIEANISSSVHIVGHSIGGAVGVLLANRYPNLSKSLTSVEGNFTLKDAFWSSRIANKSVDEMEEIIRGYRRDVESWISDAGVVPDDRTVGVGRMWLDYQPASTIRAQAKAVVEATSRPEYLDKVRALLGSDMPFHLMAGEHSRTGWDVPDWVAKAATTNTVLPGRGHLMMLEAPAAFGSALRNILD